MKPEELMKLLGESPVRMTMGLKIAFVNKKGLYWRGFNRVGEVQWGTLPSLYDCESIPGIFLRHSFLIEEEVKVVVFNIELVGEPKEISIGII